MIREHAFELIVEVELAVLSVLAEHLRHVVDPRVRRKFAVHLQVPRLFGRVLEDHIGLAVLVFQILMLFSDFFFCKRGEHENGNIDSRWD